MDSLQQLWNERRGEQFVQAMRDYVARWPDERNGSSLRGFAERWLLKRCDRALEWYTEAYELTPDYFYVSKEIAECEAELGHRDAAIAALERYIRLGRGSGLQKARDALNIRQPPGEACSDRPDHVSRLGCSGHRSPRTTAATAVAATLATDPPC
jgi:tetratricopeptide (TPR) repeat protein